MPHPIVVGASGAMAHYSTCPLRLRGLGRAALRSKRLCRSFGPLPAGGGGPQRRSRRSCGTLKTLTLKLVEL